MTVARGLGSNEMPPPEGVIDGCRSNGASGQARRWFGSGNLTDESVGMALGRGDGTQTPTARFVTSGSPRSGWY